MNHHRGPITAIATLLAIAMFLTSCSPARLGGPPDTAVVACLAGLDVVPGEVTGVFVEPGDLRNPVLAEIQGALCAIDVAVYLLTDEEVISALEHAAGRGVQVRLILEENPYGGGGGQDQLAERLRSQGIELQWSDSEFRFTHAKYMVVDRKVAVIMNLNLTVSAFTGNREFGVVTTDATAVSEAQTIFDRDWSRDRRASASGPLIVSPDNSRERYMSLIGTATISISFYAEVFRDDDVLKGLAAAVRRVVPVRMIANLPATLEDRTAMAQLAAAGIDIRYSVGAYIHAKLMIVDGKTAVVGSQNFTPTSLDSNREIAMEFDYPLAVARCSSVFELDWTAAVSGLRLDRGITAKQDSETLPRIVLAA